ncbi:hypothetical protein JI739_15310 [Ramlibacter sp. AW1]|uniref:Uncharacterized protein n=1 Tax=Ramlibacter aurantiacus TaxID=2801330 RepID=A0A936ZV56_9BURK|nr:hypothetical protein [Ramlibacter aurantiacus]
MDQAILADAFTQARLKVQWADQHFRQAQAWWQRYLESDFHELRVDRDPETGNQFITFEVNPVYAPLILSVGDGFHNLSAALDYVMSGLMRAAGKATARVTFPSHETREALHQSFMAPRPGKPPNTNRRIVEAVPWIQRLLTETVKPYRGGDFRVWEVRQLDNIDKHNLIVPSIPYVKVTGLDAVDAQGKHGMRSATVEVPTGSRIALASFASGTDLKVTNKGKATAEITFAEGLEVFAGEPLFPTASQCLQLIREVVDLIAAEASASPA